MGFVLHLRCRILPAMRYAEDGPRCPTRFGVWLLGIYRHVASSLRWLASSVPTSQTTDIPVRLSMISISSACILFSFPISSYL